LRGVLLQWDDPKHTRNHRFRLIGNQDLSMFFNALQVYGRKLVSRHRSSQMPLRNACLVTFNEGTVMIGFMESVV
jgi:hypothetical protein